MSANLVIIQLLHTQSNQTDFLRLCWDKLTDSQKKEIFYFLYNSKQYKTFLTMLRAELNLEEPCIPWTHLFAILEKFNLLKSDTLKSFINRSPQDEVGRFRLQTPELLEVWQNKKNAVLAAHEEKKTELLQSLDFAKKQGLRDQRNKILIELKQLFPNDSDVETAFYEEKEFQARHVLSKISSKNQQMQMRATTDKPDKKVLAQLNKDASSAVKKNPEMALDLAVLFFQMELYNEALKFLDLSEKKSSRVMWYELYISIEAKQYARALSAITQLKNQKDIDSEKSFSLLYFQALALHGLGQTSEARQIIRNIVKIRPHFKSATSLLLEWEGDK